MRKEEKKDITENIRWFKKFSLEKRLEIAEADRKAIEILRGLSFKIYGKLHRALEFLKEIHEAGVKYLLIGRRAIIACGGPV
jgi:hypothetical protein